MRISKSLIAVVVLVAALAVAGYVLSPFLLLRSLSFAVRNDDRDTIATDVDFPAVRDGLKQQLDDYVQSRAPKKHNAFSSLLLQLAPAIGNQVIDAIITPDGIATILRQHTTSQASGASSRPALWHGSFSWESPGHLRVTYANTRHPDQPISLDLERRGLFGWQVTGLVLPIKEIAGNN